MSLAGFAAILAAYAPVAALELSSYQPSVPPAVTATLTQADGEDPSQTIASRFPPAFTYNPGFAAVPRCPSADAERFACSAGSRIGGIEVVSPFGRAAGSVHVTEDLRIIAHLDAYGGLIRTNVTGRISALDDGSFEFVLDELPAVPVTSSRLALEGGERALFVNPRRCGSYAVGARFVSHAGAVVEQVLPIEITGCPAALRVTAVRFASGRLTWTRSEPVPVEVRVLRRSPGAWREVARRTVDGDALRLRGLRAGRYRFLVRAVAPDGRASPARGVRARLRPGVRARA